MSIFKNFNAQITIESPGRINFIGEHTDYNEGFVLPEAIDKKIIFKIKKNDLNNRYNIYSANYDAKFSLNLKDVKTSKTEWENYILGVIHEIQLLSDKLTGFDCVFSSDIPIGS